MRRLLPLFLCLAALGPALPAELPGEPGGRLTIDFAGAARLAVSASEELKNEWAQRAIREGAWLWGLRAYFPRLSFSVSEDDRLSRIGADSFLKNYSLNVDQLLWDGGRTALGRRIEKAELRLLGARLERMAGEIADAALGAYRSVLSSRAILEIREAAWESLEEQRRILAEETALGLALPSELAEAGIAVAEARLELLSLQMDLAETERQLAETLGLEELPELSEGVDVHRGAALPPAEALRSLAEARNPELLDARYSIAQKEEELKYASRSWVPSIRLTGGFGLSGQDYPLTRHNWSVGINIEFSSPWFSAGLGASAGWEPPHDRSARLQNSLSPLPDPGAALGARSSALLLSLEKKNYARIFERLGRLTGRTLERCSLADRKRLLALESLDLAGEKLRLAELRLALGQLRRIELMEARVEYSRREIAVVEAALALLEAQRELERLADLPPGELSRLGKP
jgi:outer membrane protein TolC